MIRRVEKCWRNVEKLKVRKERWVEINVRDGHTRTRNVQVRTNPTTLIIITLLDRDGGERGKRAREVHAEWALKYYTFQRENN